MGCPRLGRQTDELRILMWAKLPELKHRQIIQVFQLSWEQQSSKVALVEPLDESPKIEGINFWDN